MIPTYQSTTAWLLRGVTEALVNTIGVDIVEIGRIARLAAQPPGLGGVLTGPELEYCRGRSRPAEHMAGRFAAKEAVLKAFGTGLAGGIRWTDVEILLDDAGRPDVRLHGRASAFASERGLVALAVSISHTTHHAIAHAMAGWTPPRTS